MICQKKAVLLAKNARSKKREEFSSLLKFSYFAQRGQGELFPLYLYLGYHGESRTTANFLTGQKTFLNQAGQNGRYLLRGQSIQFRNLLEKLRNVLGFATRFQIVQNSFTQLTILLLSFSLLLGHTLLGQLFNLMLNQLTMGFGKLISFEDFLEQLNLGGLTSGSVSSSHSINSFRFQGLEPVLDYVVIIAYIARFVKRFFDFFFRINCL